MENDLQSLSPSQLLNLRWPTKLNLDIEVPDTTVHVYISFISMKPLDIFIR